MKQDHPFFIKGNIIHGKVLAEHLLEKIKKEVEELSIKPRLAVILVGNNPASEIYVNRKKITCEEMGIKSDVIHLSENTSTAKLYSIIEELNYNYVHGILLQMPLPLHLNNYEVIQRINPLKDVDGLHHENIGYLFSSTPRFVPCTPKGCLEILSRMTEIKSKHVVVVGRSLLVGRPMSALMLRNHATVTVTHRHTKDLEHFTRQADILIVAAGKPGLITRHHVKKGAIVLDVGITRVHENGEEILKGDVLFDEVAPLARYITPVPGGIGPMTVACLMQNVVKAAQLNMIK